MSSGPLLVIRADASHQGGTGHVMRTLALAQEWTNRGGKCIYLHAHEPPEGIRQRLLTETSEYQILDSEAGSEHDADATSTLLFSLNPHWLLIDSYHLGPDYQKNLKLPKRTRVAVISDFGPQDFWAPDLAIHANAATHADYSSADNKTNVLAGPDYILLRNELRSSSTPSASHEATNLLISMGGSDPREAAFSIASTLIKEGLLAHRKCRVLLGPAYPETGQAHSLSHPSIEIVQSPPDMAEQYQWADTAICSPSVTALELAHFGIPIATCITADNQTQVAQALVEQSAALLAGDFRTHEDLNIHTLTNLLEDTETRLSLSSHASNLIDGQGVDRICDTMGLPAIRFRTAQPEDAKILWEWTNDPATRQASFQSEPIPWEDHLKWLDSTLSNASRELLIVENDAHTPIAQVRFDQDNDDLFTISISLSPALRGLGLAPLIIQKAGIHLHSQHPSATIEAWIKTENTASIRSFERAGYKHDTNHPPESSTENHRVRMLSTHSL